MAEAWQSAWVEVLPDLSEFKNKTNSAITPILSDAGDRGGRGMGSAFGGVIAGAFFATILADLGTRIVGSIVGGIKSGVEFGLDYAFKSIDLASSLAETRSAVGEIFGDAAPSILAFGDSAVSVLGQTRQQALEASKTFGALGQAAGLNGEGLVDFSTQLVQLATDLASFNDTDVDTALNAIRSGLSGESEPLRQYQVFLNDALLKQKALELGIYSGNGALTDQQRILAANAAIFDKTKNQQGDFARTSDGLAGQQKKFNAALEDTQTALGEALIPAATEFITILNSDFIPILQDVIKEVGPVLSDALVASIPAFKELVTAIAPLLPDLVQLAASALPLLVQLLIILTPLLKDNAGYWTTVYKIVSDFFKYLNGDLTLRQFADDVGNSSSVLFQFAQSVGAFFGTLVNDLLKFVASFSQNVQWVVGLVSAIPARILGALGGLGDLLFRSGQSLISGFIRGIRSMLAPVTSAMSTIMARVAGFFPHSPAAYGPFSGTGWSAVKDSGRTLFAQFDSGFSGELGLAGKSLRVPAVSLPDSAAKTGGLSVNEFGPSALRLLRDALERTVELNVDGQTVARGAVSGNAQLAALGAS